MNNFIKTIRLENSLKNTLIFLPYFISTNYISFSDLIDLTYGFIIITILTSICYVTNDYTDKKKDRINKLKSKKKNLKKKQVIFLNISLIFFGLIIYNYTKLFNSYLIIYLLLFYSYNFLFKNLIFLDITMLVLFYIVRILYGSQILGIELSYWFLIFFSTLFIILSVSKRIIQISVNNLKAKNNIICYSYSNLHLLKFIVFLSFFLNLIIFILYIYEIYLPGSFKYFSTQFTNYVDDIIPLAIFFLFYISWLIRVIFLVVREKIRIDIYSFLIKDKISYLLLVIPFMLVLIYNIY